MPSNQANKLLTIHHQTPPSSQHSARSASSHVSIAAASLNPCIYRWAIFHNFQRIMRANLKFKDIKLYSGSHKQELSTQSFEMEFPTHCNVFHNWHIRCTYTGTVRAVSCRQCAMHAVCTWFMDIQNPVSHTISARRDWINLHSTIFTFFSLAVWSSVMSMFKCCIFMFFWSRCFTGACLWNRSTFLMGLTAAICDEYSPPAFMCNVNSSTCTVQWYTSWHVNQSVFGVHVGLQTKVGL